MNHHAHSLGHHTLHRSVKSKSANHIAIHGRALERVRVRTILRKRNEGPFSGLGEGGFSCPTNRIGTPARTAAAAGPRLRWTRFLFRAALPILVTALCHCIQLVQMDNPTNQPKMTHFTSGRKPLTRKPRPLQCIERWRALRPAFFRYECNTCKPELNMCHACWSTPSSHLCASPLPLFTPTCGAAAAAARATSANHANPRSICATPAAHASQSRALNVSISCSRALL